MTVLEFFVPGFPQTQAGTREVMAGNFPRQITTGSAQLTWWRGRVTEVAELARVAQRVETFSRTAVKLTLGFYLPMPRSRPAALRHAGVGPAISQLDMDKMVRAVQDSLKLAGVYRDDVEVAQLSTAKCEVQSHVMCGVWIRVEEVDEALYEALMKRREQWPARFSLLEIAELGARVKARRERARAKRDLRAASGAARRSPPRRTGRSSTGT